MEVYFVSHKDVDDNQIARIFDKEFNRIDIDGSFFHSVIGQQLVVTLFSKNSIGSCRYKLIDRFDFEKEDDSNNFIAGQRESLQECNLNEQA